LKILITGPESSGKTTMAGLLAELLDVKVINEFAVEYLENYGPDYSYDDILKMAKAHYALITKCDNENILLDTSMLNYKIWSQYKFDKVDPWIESAIQELKYDLILLMKPDIEWIYSPLRETPFARNTIFELFKTELNKLQMAFEIIDGEGNNRLLKAHDSILKTGLNQLLIKQS